MKVTNILKLTGVLTFIFVAAFVLILLRVDPFTTGKSALIYFLTLLFLALSGLLVFPGYYLRMIFTKERSASINFIVSLRQSVLISIGVVGLLILKAMESLAWWDGLLLIGALVFLEMFFRS